MGGGDTFSEQPADGVGGFSWQRVRLEFSGSLGRVGDQCFQELGKLLVLRLSCQYGQFSGRLGVDHAHSGVRVLQVGLQPAKTRPLQFGDRVDLELWGRGGRQVFTDLCQQLFDLFLFLFCPQDDQSVGGVVPGELGGGDAFGEQRSDGRSGLPWEWVGLQETRCFDRIGDQCFQELSKLLVLRLSCQYGQLSGGLRIDHSHPGVRIQHAGLKPGETRPLQFGDRVDLQRGWRGSVAVRVKLPQGFLDHRMLCCSGDHAQAERIGVPDQLGFTDQVFQGRQEPVG